MPPERRHVAAPGDREKGTAEMSRQFELGMTPAACIKSILKCKIAMKKTSPCVCGNRREVARFRSQLRVNVENTQRLLTTLKKYTATKKDLESTIHLSVPLREVREKEEQLKLLEACCHQLAEKNRNLDRVLKLRQEGLERDLADYQAAERRTKESNHRVADMSIRIAEGVKKNLSLSVQLNHEENALFEMKSLMKDVDTRMSQLDKDVTEATADVEKWQDAVAQLTSRIRQTEYASKSFHEGGNDIKLQALQGIKSLEEMDRSLNELERRVYNNLTNLLQRDAELERKWEGLAIREAALAKQMNTKSLDELEEIVEMQKAAIQAHESAWREKIRVITEQISQLEEHTSAQSETISELSQAVVRLKEMPVRFMSARPTGNEAGVAPSGVALRVRPSTATARRGNVAAHKKASTLNIGGDKSLSHFIIDPNGLAEIDDILDPDAPEMKYGESEGELECIVKGTKKAVHSPDPLGEFFHPVKQI